MKFIAITTTVMALCGCAAPQTAQISTPPAISLQVSFDSAQAQKLISDGVNIVRGNAFMRQRGGGVVTCAGSTVYLIPATDYAKRRFAILYGPGKQSGANSRTADLKFNPDPADYYSMVRTTKCDAQGNFSFDRVADGEFFVQTEVAWQVANRLQGGNLMHKVTVKGGELANLILSS